MLVARRIVSQVSRIRLFAMKTGDERSTDQNAVGEHQSLDP